MSAHRVPLRQSVEEIRLGKELEEVGHDESERNMDSSVNTVQLKRVQHTSASLANTSSRERASLEQFSLGMKMSSVSLGTYQDMLRPSMLIFWPWREARLVVMLVVRKLDAG
jgi:hypothetical protein